MIAAFSVCKYPVCCSGFLNFLLKLNLEFFTHFQILPQAACDMLNNIDMLRKYLLDRIYPMSNIVIEDMLFALKTGC